MYILLPLLKFFKIFWDFFWKRVSSVMIYKCLPSVGVWQATPNLPSKKRSLLLDCSRFPFDFCVSIHSSFPSVVFKLTLSGELINSCSSACSWPSFYIHRWHSTTLGPMSYARPGNLHLGLSSLSKKNRIKIKLIQFSFAIPSFIEFLNFINIWVTMCSLLC